MSIVTKKFSLLVAVFTLTVFLSAQISTPVVSVTTPNHILASAENSIIWETYRQPDYMDPHVNYEEAGSWMQYNIYETLFTYPWDTADTSPSVPLLAENVVISSDGLTYTFTLRQNVTFHDDTPFNATCVQMNFWRMLGRGWDDGFGPVWMVAEPILGGQAVEDAVFEYGDRSPEHIAAWENWVENVSAVVVNSEFEVEIHLAYKYAPFLSILAYQVGAMISPTFFMPHGGMSPESTDQTFYDEACGTGPYILVDLIWDDRILMTKNHNYWREADAKVTHPNAGSIDDVIIKINYDENSRMLSLQAGTTDACDWPITHAYDIYNGQTTIGNGTLQSLNPSIKVWAGSPTYDTMFLGFNMNPYLNDSGVIIQNPFTDWDLRVAISYAFDYDSCIDNTRNGFGVQLQGPIPHGMYAHDTGLFMFEYDISQAVTHWNQAMTNGLDTILANNSYELNIYYNEGNHIREATALIIKQALEDIIGNPSSADPSSTLTIDVVGLEWTNYLYKLRNKDLPIYWLDWTPDFADPHNCVLVTVKSTGTLANRIGLVGSLGESGVVWDHGTVDTWIDNAVAESNSAQRILLYEYIQEAIVDHCAYLWCYQSTSLHVERASMNGYVFNPMHDPYFYHYYKSDIVITPTTTDTSPSETTKPTGTSTGPGDSQIQPLIFIVSIGSSIVILVVVVLMCKTRRHQ